MPKLIPLHPASCLIALTRERGRGPQVTSEHAATASAAAYVTQVRKRQPHMQSNRHCTSRAARMLRLAGL